MRKSIFIFLLSFIGLLFSSHQKDEVRGEQINGQPSVWHTLILIKASLKAFTEELNGIEAIIHSMSAHRENTNSVIFKFDMKLLSLRRFEASFPLKNK